MKTQARECFVSYTQSGIFLHRSVMEKLGVGQNDVIEVKMFIDGDLAANNHSLVKPKKSWDLEIEKRAYGKWWYSPDIIQEFMRKPSCLIMGYIDWHNLTLGVGSWVCQLNPTLELKKCGKTNECKQLGFKILTGLPSIAREKSRYYEYADVVEEKREILLWCHTRKTRKNPINLRKVGLESLYLLASKRRAILNKNAINNILELISSSPEQLRNIKGISYDLLKRWICDSSKVLRPSAYPLRCKVFLTNPREQRLIATKKTLVEILSPYYSQFFVRGHSKVESKILDELHGQFGAFYNINMTRESYITLSKKDGSREVNIFGPWIVEMIGFKEEDEVKEFLKELKTVVEIAFKGWGEKDVVQLIKPQDTYIEADQILESLIRELMVEYSSPKEILLKMAQNREIVVDTNVLIDGRLSSLMVRAMQGALEEGSYTAIPDIIIPNIVSYEIKSMIDRPASKEVQYRLADKELLRLRALHDTGYINLKYIGEIPLLPPITEQQKGTWKFYSSLRDEYILRVLEKLDSPILVTQDGRLARSAYIKGFDVVHIRPLIKGIKEDFGHTMKNFKNLTKYEQENILIHVGNKLLVSKETIIEVMKLQKSMHS